MDFKVCTKCNVEKPATTEFYNRKARGKYGLDEKCKSCRSVERKQNSEHISQYNKEWRAKSEYVHQDEYRAQRAEYCKQWRLKDAEQYKAKCRQSYADHIEQRKEYRDAHRDIRLAQRRAWGTVNPDKSRSYSHRRRAICNTTPHTLTSAQWIAIQSAFDNKCCYCGKSQPLEQEHFVAVSKLGEYTHNNILPACKSCNISKHDKDFFAWYPSYKFYSKSRESKILRFLNYSDNGTQQLRLFI